MPNPDEKKDEKQDEKQDERQEEQGSPAEDEGSEDEPAPDPMAGMTQMLADLRAEIASFKEDMAGIHATLGAMANQQALSDSLEAEDEAGDDKPSDEQYPSFDLDDFARTIGDY